MDKLRRDATVHVVQSKNILSNKQLDFTKGSANTLHLLTGLVEWTEILKGMIGRCSLR